MGGLLQLPPAPRRPWRPNPVRKTATKDPGPICHRPPPVPHLAAENRLGYPLDPHYREFPSIADGWENYDFDESLLGTGDLGLGPRWDEAIDTLHWFVGDIGPVDAPRLGIPDDYAHSHLPIGDRLCLLTRDIPQGPAGSVFPLYIDPAETYPDLYTYLTTHLPFIASSTSSIVLGPPLGDMGPRYPNQPTHDHRHRRQDHRPERLRLP